MELFGEQFVTNCMKFIVGSMQYVVSSVSKMESDSGRPKQAWQKQSRQRLVNQSLGSKLDSYYIDYTG